MWKTLVGLPRPTVALRPHLASLSLLFPKCQPCCLLSFHITHTHCSARPVYTTSASWNFLTHIIPNNYLALSSKVSSSDKHLSSYKVSPKPMSNPFTSSESTIHLSFKHFSWRWFYTDLYKHWLFSSFSRLQAVQRLCLLYFPVSEVLDTIPCIQQMLNKYSLNGEIYTCTLSDLSFQPTLCTVHAQHTLQLKN